MCARSPASSSHKARRRATHRRPAVPPDELTADPATRAARPPTLQPPHLRRAQRAAGEISMPFRVSASSRLRSTFSRIHRACIHSGGRPAIQLKVKTILNCIPRDTGLVYEEIRLCEEAHGLDADASAGLTKRNTKPATEPALPRRAQAVHWKRAVTEVVPVLLPMVRLTITGLVRPVRLTPEAST